MKALGMVDFIDLKTPRSKNDAVTGLYDALGAFFDITNRASELTFWTVWGERLRWGSEQDNGIYDAMNKGIRMASGELIGMIGWNMML